MVSEFLGHRVLVHDGSVDGFPSAAWRLPEEHIFVAVLTNSDSPELTFELGEGGVVKGLVFTLDMGGQISAIREVRRGRQASSSHSCKPAPPGTLSPGGPVTSGDGPG